MCTGPHTFQHLYGLDSGEDVGEIKLWCIIWNVKISDLDFADDVVVFAKTLDILLGALELLIEESECWDFGFPGSKLRSRLSMTSWMLLSCLYLFVVRMLRSQRDSLTLAVIFMSLLAVSQRSTDVWARPGESWIRWIMGCVAAGTCVGGRKSEYSGPWCFQSCSMDV